MGPVESLLQLGEDLSLSIFEANIEPGDISWDKHESLIADSINRYGTKISIISQCLSDHIGKEKFHINVMPDSSSLLEMSPNAKNYQKMTNRGYRIIWGDICQTNRVVEINVTTLDELYDRGVIQMPHFLSLDVQGVEYNILEGASKALQGDLLGVLSEVEFRELYKGQKLFTDQYILLKKHQFDLFELYNMDYMHPATVVGKGALMVAEALFLRDFEYFVRKDKEPSLLLSNLSKLAIVAYCFNRKSYAYEIIEYIYKNWQSEWDIFIQQNANKYLHKLCDFYWKTKNFQKQIEKAPTYSQLATKNPITLWRYRLIKLFTLVSYLIYNLNLKMIKDKLMRRRKL